MTLGLAPTTDAPFSSLSAKRFLLCRAGHGRILDVDTVKTVAKKVKPKSEETKAGRRMNRRALYVGILALF